MSGAGVGVSGFRHEGQGVGGGQWGCAAVAAELVRARSTVACTAGPRGFVAARVAALAPSVAAGPSVRLELGAGAGRVEMHWPLAHTRELATWLREYTR